MLRARVRMRGLMSGTALVAAPGTLSLTGAPVAAQWGIALSAPLTISGGSGSYTLAGLPSGITGAIVGSTLTISGSAN